MKVFLHISNCETTPFIGKNSQSNPLGHLIISCGMFVLVHVVENVCNIIVCEVLFSCFKLSLVTLSI